MRVQLKLLQIPPTALFSCPVIPTPPQAWTAEHERLLLLLLLTKDHIWTEAEILCWFQFKEALDVVRCGRKEGRHKRML